MASRRTGTRGALGALLGAAAIGLSAITVVDCSGTPPGRPPSSDASETDSGALSDGPLALTDADAEVASDAGSDAILLDGGDSEPSPDATSDATLDAQAPGDGGVDGPAHGEAAADAMLEGGGDSGLPLDGGVDATLDGGPSDAGPSVEGGGDSGATGDAGADANGGPLCNSRLVTYPVGKAPSSVAVGDLNGDGRPDLVVTNSNQPGSNGGTVGVLINTGNANGDFVAQVTYTAGTVPTAVALADFNGDGKPDLVVTDEVLSGGPLTGAVDVFINSGSGTFAGFASYAAGSEPDSVATGDFNRDGRPDIVAADLSTGDVNLLLNTDGGAFALKSTSGSCTPDPRSIAVGDFNGDDFPDLVIADFSYGGFGYSVCVYPNGGGGAFGAGDPHTVVDPSSVAVADFNGDGKPDIVSGSGDPLDYFSVLLNLGDFVFAPAVNYPVSNPVIGVAVGDFNGDGKPDLVGGEGSNSAVVVLNAGDGTFGAQGTYTVGNSPWSVAVGDFNGDGKLDLVTANESSNTVSVLFNGCP